MAGIISRLFSKNSHETRLAPAKTTKIIVCAFDPKFSVLVQEDSAAYLNHYPHTNTVIFSNADEFEKELEKHFDVVHLFCDVDETGAIEGTNYSGSGLIRRCYVAGVTLLWIASENDANGYINGFHPEGRPINLVMTINRKGAAFQAFLSELLAKMATGKSMPRAWVEIAPQTTSAPIQEELPETIFSAGFGQLRLL